MSLLLGIESSCDETAVALVADGRRVVAERVASQADVFAEWGGVVPEIAARGHVGWLPGLVEAVLEEAACRPADIDAIAVGSWPGLIGSLLVGVTCAKTLALAWQRPLVAVDHVQAHLAAVQLGREQVPYPLVGLVVSGGHSHLYHCHGPGQGDLLGGTIDDAAGEAFDKAAATMELGYPGGPLIDARAARGDPRAYALPRSFLRDDSLRFSFSGVKTALLYQLRGPQGRDALQLDEAGIADACASFQAAVVDCLVGKTLQAVARCGVAAVTVGGGVACNSGLRRAMAEACTAAGVELLLPEPRHCLDNAAMIAALGTAQWQRGAIADASVTPLPTGRAGSRRP